LEVKEELVNKDNKEDIKTEEPEQVKSVENEDNDPVKLEKEEKPLNDNEKEKNIPKANSSNDEKSQQDSDLKQEKGNVDDKSNNENQEKNLDLSLETDPQSIEADDIEEEPPKTENLKEMDLKDVLKINNSVINFGDLFPGQILEETVIILNNLTSTKVPFKIKINCLSQEFDDLDEYVYSMRRPTTQDVFNYNDTFLILLAQKAISYYKLAIKVPNILEEKEISGNIEITCTDCKNGRIVIPIKSRIGKYKYSYINKFQFYQNLNAKK
jgi:hypothetical protein